MKNIIYIAFSLLILVGCKSKDTNTTTTAETAASINWITIQEAQEKIKTHPKKIMIDVYATWCGPCKRMAKYTFTDPKVVSYINQKFYAVKFNAERTDSIKFLEKTYTNQGRTHSLSMVLAANQGSLSYPTIAYFDEDFKRLAAVPGYYKPDGFLTNARFYGENEYKSKTLNQYLQSLKTLD